MIPRNFFAKCSAIERTIEAIYLHWAGVDCYTTERRAMWKKLSQDEEGHALDLELASRLVTQDDDVAATIDMAVLDQLQGDLSDLLVAIKQSPFSDAQAVKAAVDVEARTMALHANSAVIFSDPELKRMFSALGTYDKAHLAALAQAYAELFKDQPAAMLHAGSNRL